VNKASGDTIGQVDDVTGAFLPLTGMPVLSANKRCRGTVFGEVPIAYFGNDTNGIIISRDGESAEQLTGTQIPTSCYVGGPFYDRLLAWHGKRLFYSRTNIPDDWSDPDTGNQQYVLVQHPEDITCAFTPGPDRTEVGFMGKLYVCTPTSTWIKNQDFGTGTLTKIHETAGVAAMNTVAWTDRGAVALGMDNVWIFPFDGLPVEIGGALEPVLQAIPKAQIHRCSATFRRGFYILSIVREGLSDPDVEYWCDLRAYNANRADKGIYWIGPMVRGSSGKGIECFLYQSQVPDEQELLGFGATEGRVSNLEDKMTYLDYGETMTSLFITPDVDGSVPMEKAFTGLVVGLYAVDVDEISVRYAINENEQENGLTIAIGAEQGEWDYSTWDTATWAGPKYYLLHRLFLDRPVGQRGRVTITHTTDQEFSFKECYLTVEPFGRI
jgi:hypothetical protein